MFRFLFSNNSYITIITFIVSCLFLTLGFDQVHLTAGDLCSENEKGTSAKLAAFVDTGSKIRPISLVFEICEKSYNGISINQLQKNELSLVELAFVRRVKNINEGNYDSIMDRIYMKHPSVKVSKKQAKSSVKALFKGAYGSMEEPLREIGLRTALFIDKYVLILYKVPSEPYYYSMFMNVDGEWKTAYFGWYFKWAGFWKDLYEVNKSEKKTAQKILEKRYKHRVSLHFENNAPVFISYNGTSYENVKLLGGYVPKNDVHPALKTYYRANKAIEEGDYKKYTSYYFGQAKKNRKFSNIKKEDKRKKYIQRRQEALRSSLNKGKYLFYVLKAPPLYVMFYRQKKNGSFVDEINYDMVIKRSNNTYKMLTDNQSSSITSFLSSKYFKKRMLPRFVSHLSGKDK